MPDYNKKPTTKQMQSATYNLYGIGQKPKASKPRKKPVQGEAQFQAACIRWFNLQYPELYYSLFAVPNGGSRNSTEAVNLNRQGLTSGVSDLIFCYQGRTTFIELKNPNGKGTQTENQRQFEDHIKQQMFAYHIIDNFEDFQDLIRGIVK